LRARRERAAEDEEQGSREVAMSWQVVGSVIVLIVIAVVVIAIVVWLLHWLYRRSSKQTAFVRTGFGGQRIVLSGGCLVLPFLHRVEEIGMGTMRVEVRRTGEKSLIAADRIRVDVELEFYVRVQPSVDGVATAGQAIGAVSQSVGSNAGACGEEVRGAGEWWPRRAGPRGDRRGPRARLSVVLEFKRYLASVHGT